jgi:hypothetical protein
LEFFSCLTFERKYKDKELYVAFPDDGAWYLYRHDELLEKILAGGNVGSTQSWQQDRVYHFSRLSKGEQACGPPTGSFTPPLKTDGKRLIITPLEGERSRGARLAKAQSRALRRHAGTFRKLAK